jgi:hypothetical protein
MARAARLHEAYVVGGQMGASDAVRDESAAAAMQEMVVAALAPVLAAKDARIAEVEATLVAVQNDRASWKRACHDAQQERDTARAELAKLREAASNKRHSGDLCEICGSCFACIDSAHDPLAAHCLVHGGGLDLEPKGDA